MAATVPALQASKAPKPPTRVPRTDWFRVFIVVVVLWVIIDVIGFLTFFHAPITAAICGVVGSVRNAVIDATKSPAQRAAEERERLETQEKWESIAESSRLLGESLDLLANGPKRSTPFVRPSFPIDRQAGPLTLTVSSAIVIPSIARVGAGGVREGVSTGPFLRMDFSLRNESSGPVALPQFYARIKTTQLLVEAPYTPNTFFDDTPDLDEYLAAGTSKQYFLCFGDPMLGLLSAGSEPTYDAFIARGQRYGKSYEMLVAIDYEK